MKRKVLSLILAIMLVVSLFAGCSKGGNGPNASENQNSKAATTDKAGTAEETAAAEVTTGPDYGDTGGLKLPIVDKPITLTWMLTGDEMDYSNTLFVKEIEKRTGIKLDIQAYPDATYGEKLKVILASGKLPDIIGGGLSQAEINKLGAQGAFVPINQYADQLPNFKTYFVDTPVNSKVVNTWTDDNNNLYTWPIYEFDRPVNFGFMYRKDIFDKLGIPEWTNTEEFYQALRKLKEANPNSYPFAQKTGQQIFLNLGYGWGISGESWPAYYDENTETWKFSFTQPEFKDMIDFLKKLYNEGLLDPEFLTDTEASWTVKMVNNDKSFVTWDWIGRLELFYNQIKDQNPEYNLRYAIPIGPTKEVRRNHKVANWGPYVANNENKEAALKLLDYLTSPSGGTLATMGVENETFVLENGKAVYPELKEGPVDTTVLLKKYGLWLASTYVHPDPRSVYYNYTEKEQEVVDKMAPINETQTIDIAPKLSDDEAKTIADLQVSLEKAGIEFAAKYIMTKEHGESQWTAWLKEAESLGAGKFIETYNAAQQRAEAQ